jgi:hypothetical protein
MDYLLGSDVNNLPQSGIRYEKQNKDQLLHRITRVWTTTNLQFLLCDLRFTSFPIDNRPLVFLPVFEVFANFVNLTKSFLIFFSIHQSRFTFEEKMIISSFSFTFGTIQIIRHIQGGR